MVDFIHMSPYDYEQMCESLLAEEYAAEPIRVSVGDGGIDSFHGSLSEEVAHVWQYKHFPDGLGDAQKNQIRESLKTVVTNYKPKEWTLVVPCNLTQAETKWFEKLTKDYTKKNVTLHVLGKTRLLNLLLKHQAVKQFYFPDAEALLKVTNALLGGKDAAFLKPKASVLDLIQDGVDYINRDSPDVGFRVTTDESGQTVEVFSRNPNVNPVVMRGTLLFPNDKKGRQARKRYDNMLRKGIPCVLTSEHFQIDWAVFDELVGEGFRPFAIEMSPLVPKVQVASRLVVVKQDGETVEIPFIDLKMKRKGQDEVELTNEAQDTVFKVSLVIGKTGSFNVRVSNIVGRRPTEVSRAYDFLLALGTEGARVQLHVLERDAVLSSAISGTETGDPLEVERVDFYRHLADVERLLDGTLTMPKEYTSRDMANAAWLSQVLNGEAKTKHGVVNTTLTVGNPDGLLKSIADGETVTLVTTAEETVTLFGRTYVLDADVRMKAALEPDQPKPDYAMGEEVQVTATGDAELTYKGGRIKND